MLAPNIIFGYHGCDESIARVLLDGGRMKPSQNAYDWLGHGSYLWEGSARRGLLWAQEMAKIKGSGIKKPAVIGAIVDLGHCLDLIDPLNVALVRDAYRSYLANCELAGIPPLRNKGPESKARFLDCAVMNLLHDSRKDVEMPPFDTVRGFFVEGEPIYPTAGLRSLDHIQVCVRNPKCIRGFFRPSLDVL